MQQGIATMTLILDGVSKKQARTFAWYSKTLQRYIAQIRTDGDPAILAGFTSQNVNFTIDGTTILINPMQHNPHDKGQILAETINAYCQITGLCQDDVTAHVFNGIFEKTFRQ
jgi:hypothetical protein